MNFVTCKNHFLDGICNWVSFRVSREYAENQVTIFNNFYETLPIKQQFELYSNCKATIKDYEHCHRCGGSYKNFRKSTRLEVPFGSTVNPIINRKE